METEPGSEDVGSPFDSAYSDDYCLLEEDVIQAALDAARATRAFEQMIRRNERRQEVAVAWDTAQDRLIAAAENLLAFREKSCTPFFLLQGKVAALVEGDEWMECDPDYAACMGYSVITCSQCNQPATQVDIKYPHTSAQTLCEQHAAEYNSAERKRHAAECKEKNGQVPDL